MRRRLGIDFSNMSLAEQLLSLAQVGHSLTDDQLAEIRGRCERARRQRAAAPAAQEAEGSGRAIPADAVILPPELTDEDWGEPIGPDDPEFTPTAEDLASYREWSEALEMRRWYDENGGIGAFNDIRED